MCVEVCMANTEGESTLDVGHRARSGQYVVMMEGSCYLIKQSLCPYMDIYTRRTSEMRKSIFISRLVVKSRTLQRF